MTTRQLTHGWREAKLEQLVFFQRGIDITQAHQRPGDYPVISSSGISSYHDEFKAAGPGVIIGRKGTLGSIHYSSGDYWPHDTTLWSKDLRGNNPKFVFYYLHTLDLGRFDVGSSNPTLNRNHIHDLPIQIPTSTIQNKIATILTAYDDALENNRRRMGLLEKAARLLYEEWFVRLRFPGHEHTRITNGLPQGWKRVPLGERVTLNYGKALKADTRVEGEFPVYGSSGIVGSHEVVLAKGPGIILGRKGNVGSVFWSSKDFYAIDTVYFITAEESDLYLYYALKHMHFISTDVAVPGLNRDLAYSRPLLVPSKIILRQFLEVVAPIHQQLDKLKEINQKLRTARDLLLPRLMSGEIEV